MLKSVTWTKQTWTTQHNTVYAQLDCDFTCIRTGTYAVTKHIIRRVILSLKVVGRKRHKLHLVNVPFQESRQRDHKPAPCGMIQWSVQICNASFFQPLTPRMQFKGTVTPDNISLILYGQFKGTVSRKLRHRLLYIIRKLFFYTFDARYKIKLFCKDFCTINV